MFLACLVQEGKNKFTVSAFYRFTKQFSDSWAAFGTTFKVTGGY
jgi:hypothetical protein